MDAQTQTAEAPEPFLKHFFPFKLNYHRNMSDVEVQVHTYESGSRSGVYVETDDSCKQLTTLCK